MKWKKILALGMAAVMTAAFVTGCGGQKAADNGSGSGDKGKIIVGLDDNFPPMGFKDENNKTIIHDPIGFCMFILSHVDGSSWGTALTNQCGKCRNEINNRETKTDTG